MPEEVVEAFQPTPPGTVIDATFGAGGHSRLLLEARFQADGARDILAIDQDPTVPPPTDPRIRLVTGNFRHLREIVEGHEGDEIVGVLFDLGFSSPQMDDPSRGLSYRHEGPLDMRLDRGSSSDQLTGQLTGHGPFRDRPTAADIVNRADVTELTRIIAKYGEDPVAGRIARAIVAARPLETTGDLADVISNAVPAALRRKRHPARRTFQALRIAVNDELAALEAGLEAALDLVVPGGRIAVLSYHSLEDRIVKQAFRARSEPDDGLMPVPTAAATHREINRRPRRPSEAEVAYNPRARSAKLRVAERI
jgi:16S rRNA (cytosine1402-N4)-methyltransferase